MSTWTGWETEYELVTSADEKPPIKDATPPTLDKGKNPGDMLKQAYEFLNKHSGTGAEKEKYFKDKLVPQISKAYDGWKIEAEFDGPNGAKVLSGKIGEAVVFDKDGNIYTGKFPGTAFTIGAGGKITDIDYSKLTKR